MDPVIHKSGILKEMARKKQSKAGGDKKSEGSLLTLCPTVEPSIDVRKTLAEEADVGEVTMGRYMRAMEDGSPELPEKMKRGGSKSAKASGQTQSRNHRIAHVILLS